MKRYSFRLSIVLLAIASAAAAQDGLYAPRLPGDAALVRVVNLDDSASSPRIDAGSVRFESLAPGEAGPYRPVAPGIYLIGARGRGAELNPAPGAFHTIVTLPGGDVRIFEDEAHRDPARAQIVLYNLSAVEASLSSVDPAGGLIESVGAGESEAIVVNAIPVELSAVRGGVEALRRSVVLDRGASYAVFVGESFAALHTARVDGE
ncbi:MAG: alginate O-acetyltransferase AlgF [Spirochaetales bacterium]|nr:alginate O-acetyltransferase AlgF [Spirochaetales bacterium]